MDLLEQKEPNTNLDNLLAKYVAGEATPNEIDEVDHWVSINATNKKQLELLEIIWNKSGSLVFSGPLNSLRSLNNLENRISKKPAVSLSSGVLKLNWKYAAAIILLVVIGLIVLLKRSNINDVLVKNRISIGNGNRIDTLPDHTIVFLQQSARLEFPAVFQGKSRNVKLEGNASFSVTHDPAKPFVVSVRDIHVKDLGTSFNITTTLDQIEIEVKTGTVEISGRQQQQILHANEKLIIPGTTTTWIKSENIHDSINLRKTDLPVVHSPQTKNVRNKLSGPGHSLLVGDVAPILPLDKWMKGGPLNIYDKRKVYLVDFWALWCGPCIAGMDRLNDLQKKYKDQGLEVMSVTSEDDWGNSYDKVVHFIDSNSKKYDYNFAWLPLSYRSDHKYKSIIYNPWLQLAYDSSSWALPQVFLIDRNGKIAFIGDGFNLDENLVASVLDDSYDLESERKKYIEKLSLEQDTIDFLAMMDNKNLPEALKLGEKIVRNSLVTSHTLMVISDNIFNKYRAIQTKELIDLGFESAKKGVKITGSHSPGHLAVLAKGYSLIGDPDQAVKVIKTAIELSEGDYRLALEKDLKTYEEMGKSKK